MCSIYSGTVAGAREAAIAGVPGIALSLDWYTIYGDHTFLCANFAIFLVPLLQ